LIAMERGLAHWLRLALGFVIVVVLGVDSYYAERGVALTFVLPVAIGILVAADFIGYLSSRSSAEESNKDNKAL